MWPKNLRQAPVLCAGLAPRDAHAAWNHAEGLTVRTERAAARPVRTTVQRLTRAARAHVVTAARHAACPHLRGAVQAA